MIEKLKKHKLKIIMYIIFIILIAIITLFINKQVQKARIKKTIGKMEKDLQSTISNITPNISSTSTNSITDNQNNSSKEDTKTRAEVNIGQTVTVDDYLEYSFIESKFTTKLEPSNPDSWYSYYEAKSVDNTLLAIKTKIKNLQTEQFDGEKIPKATILYDGKYTYDCIVIVEEDDGSDLDGYDWYKDIDPLKTKTFYYYVEIPKEFETDSKPLSLRIDIQNNSYELKIR